MTAQPTNPQGSGPAGGASGSRLDPALQGQLRSLQDVLRAWLVRVVLVMAVMFALNHYMGPVRWFWPLIGFYAFVSLVAGVGAARFMNRNIIEAHAAATARDADDLSGDTVTAADSAHDNSQRQATDLPGNR